MKPKSTRHRVVRCAILSVLGSLPSLILVFGSSASASTGDLQITCPPGFRVYLDGKFIGLSRVEEDGKYLTDLNPGDHVLRVEKQEYKPFTQRITIISGQAIEIKVSRLVPEVRIVTGGESEDLAIERRVGAIRVRCAPIRCEFNFVKNRYRLDSDASFRLFENIPSGEHYISFSRLGDTIAGMVHVEANKTLEVRANFLEGTMDISQEKPEPPPPPPLPPPQPARVGTQVPPRSTYSTGSWQSYHSHKGGLTGCWGRLQLRDGKVEFFPRNPSRGHSFSVRLDEILKVAESWRLAAHDDEWKIVLRDGRRFNFRSSDGYYPIKEAVEKGY